MSVVIPFVGFGVLCVLLLVANAVSPWPAYAGKLAFGRVVLAVHGYDPAFACFAIDSHADLRADLAKVRGQRDALAEEVEAMQVVVKCCEVKCENYEDVLEAIAMAQTVPLGYVQGLARAALHENVAS